MILSTPKIVKSIHGRPLWPLLNLRKLEALDRTLSLLRNQALRFFTEDLIKFGRARMLMGIDCTGKSVLFGHLKVNGLFSRKKGSHRRVIGFSSETVHRFRPPFDDSVRIYFARFQSKI
jgi:hypothetical protein